VPLVATLEEAEEGLRRLEAAMEACL
jgi:hypothetical protein